MVQTRNSFKRLAIAAALALPLAGIAVVPWMMKASAHSQLQELTDQAAIAGLESLIATADRPDAERSAISIAAAGDAASDAKSATSREIEVAGAYPSANQPAMTVELSDPSTGDRARATARYILPSAGAPAQQANTGVTPKLGGNDRAGL